MGYWPSVRSRWLDIGQVLFLRVYKRTANFWKAASLFVFIHTQRRSWNEMSFGSSRGRRARGDTWFHWLDLLLKVFDYGNYIGLQEAVIVKCRLHATDCKLHWFPPTLILGADQNDRDRDRDPWTIQHTDRAWLPRIHYSMTRKLNLNAYPLVPHDIISLSVPFWAYRGISRLINNHECGWRVYNR